MTALINNDLTTEVEGEETSPNFEATPIHMQLVIMYFKEKHMPIPNEFMLKAIFEIMNHLAIRNSFHNRNSLGENTGIIAQVCQDNKIPVAELYQCMMGEPLYIKPNNESTDITPKLNLLDDAISSFVNSKLDKANV